MIIEITRADLYALLWRKPITILEKELGVSYHELKRICKEKDIPMPESGYWTKVRLGKAVNQPALKAFDGEDKIDLVRFRTVKRIKLPSPEVTAELPLLMRPAKFEPLVERLKQYLKGKDVYSNDGLLIAGREYLDVKVSPAHVNRACIILDAFIRMMRKRGHDILVRNDKSYVLITGHEIQFKLRERLKRVENPKSEYSFDKWMMVTTGLLLIKMEGYHSKEWIDGKILLDHQLENIMLRMEEAARHKDAFRLQQDKWQEDYHKKEAEKKIVEDQKKKDEEDFQMLMNNSTKWREVKMLREYIGEVERRAVEAGTLSKKLVEWLMWARKKADALDPFARGGIEAGTLLLSSQMVELLERLASYIFSVHAILQSGDEVGSLDDFSVRLMSSVEVLLEQTSKGWSSEFESGVLALLEDVERFGNEVNKRKAMNALIPPNLVDACAHTGLVAEEMREMLKK